MPDVLLELLSEEIPARMQQKAENDLKTQVAKALLDKDLTFTSIESISTPRRLALCIAGLPIKTRDREELRLGPKVGAPDKAIEGFMRASNVNNRAQLIEHDDPKKGRVYAHTVHHNGRTAEDLVKEALEETLQTFPWPKSMRWGAGSTQWVRPLRNILCMSYDESADGEKTCVPVSFAGLTANDTTKGHAWHAPEEIKVQTAAEYFEKLKAARVILNREDRKAIILHDAKSLCFAQGLSVREDPALLEEVAGLVEYPVVHIGRFDAAFLALPEDVIRLTIKTHQKCFVVEDSKTGQLANAFVIVANMAASDGGAELIKGNERVIRARLSDAKFFFDSDVKTPLQTHLDKLKAIIFHEKIGTQFERVNRIKNWALALNQMLATHAGTTLEADDKVARAATLAKTDLLTEVVGELPELQGKMGAIYAKAQGEAPDVAAAIEEHYLPQGPQDRVPTAPLSVRIALADKLDILCEFWRIDQKPTGSKDPYALRRAALGVIRILKDNALNISLNTVIDHAELETDVAKNLTGFLADRLRGILKDEGHDYDVADAAIDETNLNIPDILDKCSALATLKTSHKRVLNLIKRAGNIVDDAIEKDGIVLPETIDPSALVEQQEKALLEAYQQVQGACQNATRYERLEHLSQLAEPINAFFEAVIVNADDQMLRTNRLALLNATRALAAPLGRVALLVDSED